MKHVVITGGSSGIGFALAQILVKRGEHVSLISRDLEKLNNAVGQLKADSSNSTQKICGYSADVSNNPMVAAAIKSAIEEAGVPDILITSAGMVEPGPFEKQPLEFFEKTMQVNYFGTVNVVKTVLPYMLERKQGHLMLISSMAGLIGSFGYSSYGPSKAALKNFAEILRLELKPKGIQVSICYPPDTDTPQLAYESRNKTEEMKLLNAVAGLYTPDFVASCIINGIEKNNFAIVPGKMNYLLYAIGNPVLPFWFKRADKIIKKSTNISNLWQAE